MSNTQSFAIPFVIEGIPDCQGIRIRATNPTGLYVSSTEREAAFRWFENIASFFIMEQKHLRLGPGEGTTCAEQYNWEEFVKNGKGEISIRVIPRQEIDEMMKDAKRVIVTPYKKLEVSCFTRPNQPDMFIVHDPEGIDSWIVNASIEDLKKASAVRN